MSNEPDQPPQLTHLDEQGNARMVDVGAKAVTQRMARARATVQLSPQTAQAVAAGDAPKGDVLGTARLAGIMAAKRCVDLIPLAHPIPISFVDVAAAVDTESGTVTLISEARTAGQTGIEMEAMTACAVAALTVYDMVKGIERGVKISCVELLEKTGGKHDWRSDSNGDQA
ncbi:MAG: cyclic pyranopterin monophosphate synthase MoaC [Thermoleophilaceae bacterium]|nr:cyclic pyranopterin monophosphate synthase MoaC [Thermoleophilaceae bacterium]